MRGCACSSDSSCSVEGSSRPPRRVGSSSRQPRLWDAPSTVQHTLCTSHAHAPSRVREACAHGHLHCMRRLTCFLILSFTLAGCRPATQPPAAPTTGRPRAAPGLRGDHLPRRRRPGAAPGGDQRRHRVRQAARAGTRADAGAIQGPRRAEGYRRRRPGRPGRVLRRLPGHRRLWHRRCGSTRATLLHDRRRGLPAEAGARPARPDDAGRTGVEARVQAGWTLVRAHRQAHHLRRRGATCTCRSGARRRLPGPQPPARRARRRSVRPARDGTAACGSSMPARSVRPRRTAAATPPASAASWR